MKKIIFLFLLVFCCVFLFGKYKIDLKLDKIISTNKVDEEMKPTGEDSFSDDWFSIKWIPAPVGFHFELMNNSNTPLSINWYESAFLNEYKESSKVIDDETRLIDKDQYIRPTDIPVKAKIKETVYPLDYWIYGNSKKFGAGNATNKWRNTKLMYFTNVNKLGYGTKVNEWRYVSIWNTKINDKEYAEMKDKDLVFRVILNVRNGYEKRYYHFFFKSVANKI